MFEVIFYEVSDVENCLLKFVVIVSKYQGKWIFCKHKNRNTWEVPGGHREDEESILDTAKRELYEETGAKKYTLTPVCVYSVKNEIESFGMLYFADVEELNDLPESEIERIAFFDDIPNQLTYPHIQPKLMDKVKEALHVV